MKDNFLLSIQQKEVVDTLTDEEAGILFKAIYQYASTKEETLSGALQAIFIQFRNFIDFNNEKYMKKVEYDKKRYREKKEEMEKSEKKWNEMENEFSQNSHNSYIITHNSNNITHNSNNLEKIECEKEKPLATDDDSSLFEITKEIIEYLNSKTDSNFRYSSKATQSKINARLNEGYTLDDFIVVIDKKTNEWLNDEKFSKYLCPETLFGTKFEKYLNQKTKETTKKKDEQMDLLRGVYDGTIKIN